MVLVVGFAAVKKLKTISKNEPQGWDLRENHGQKKFFLFYLAENLGRCLNCWKQLVFEHELRESNKGTQPKGSHLLSHSWWLHSVICTIQLLKERFLLNKFMNRSSNFSRKSFPSISTSDLKWSVQSWQRLSSWHLSLVPMSGFQCVPFCRKAEGAAKRYLGSPWTLIHSFELSLGLPNVWSSYNRTTASNWASTDWSSAQRKLSLECTCPKNVRIFCAFASSIHIVYSHVDTPSLDGSVDSRLNKAMKKKILEEHNCGKPGSEASDHPISDQSGALGGCGGLGPWWIKKGKPVS